MAPKSTKLAIMFADISGSTQLYETLGDITARHKVAECLETITDVIKRHKGTVIKTIGDEVMCTFPSADLATSAACEMNEVLEDEATQQTEAGPVSLSIRVGMHYGSAIREGGDVFGDAVNLAARMASIAKAGQIITTQSTVENLSPILRASTRFIDRAPVKGKKDAIDIFEVIWQQEEVTRMASGVLNHSQASTLRIRYRDGEIKLDDEQPSIVMGRSHTCDVTIDETLASRHHVRIECRRGKFFIIDQSTNGTYVCIDDNDESFLRREEMPLSGSGRISLGRSFTEEPKEVVVFLLEE